MGAGLAWDGFGESHVCTIVSLTRVIQTQRVGVPRGIKTVSAGSGLKIKNLKLKKNVYVYVN